MSQIIKDKDGKVLKTMPDTGYHNDGTGPRDANGVLIAPTADEADAGGIEPAVVEEIKSRLAVGLNPIDDTTTPAAAKAANSKRED